MRLTEPCMANLHYIFKIFLTRSCTLTALLLSANVYAAELQEYELKAAFLYNYALYVEWPDKITAPPKDHFQICLLGSDPFEGHLEKILGPKNVSGKPIRIRKLAKTNEFGSCQMLYISAPETKHLAEILNAAKKYPTLTVSDIPEFTKKGGMINFVLHDNKVRFFINNTVATEDGLKISSQLLKLALNTDP